MEGIFIWTGVYRLSAELSALFKKYTAFEIYVYGRQFM